MTLAEFNTLPGVAGRGAAGGLLRLIAVEQKRVASRRPYETADALHKAADSVWWKLERADWLEAFSHHPQIGEQAAAGSERARELASGEQAGARIATGDVKERLARLQSRLPREIRVYLYRVCHPENPRKPCWRFSISACRMIRRAKFPLPPENSSVWITRIRLDKLLASEGELSMPDAITTHVLDTSTGRPAAILKIELHVKSSENWKFVGAGMTDENGRCGALLGEAPFAAGTYRLTFHTGAYTRRSTWRRFIPIFR